MSINRRISNRERLKRVYYFFPFQLLLLHIKKNHLLLVAWFVLYSYVSSGLATRYGVPTLFLAPEYMGKIDFKAYTILGFSCGAFIMAFNMYSYIMHGFRFHFIASLSRPFFKFTVNNFIIPVLFVAAYLFFSAEYQLNKELFSTTKVIINLFSFIMGNAIFILVSFAYFFTTNKDVLKIFKTEESINKSTLQSIRKNLRRWQSLEQNKRTWRVETYLAHPFKIQLARESKHYDRHIIMEIMSQNHINASIFEIITIISFFSVGFFREWPLFMIPAGASIFMIFTIMLMGISALYSWFKGWTMTIIVLFFIMVNMAASRQGLLNIESRAYGVDYTVKSVVVSEKLTPNLPTPYNMSVDKQYVAAIIKKRVKYLQKKYGVEKPKLIIINNSGGGLRSALWSFRMMSHLDSLTQGAFNDHTMLITGSSGGMLGSAYFRELKHREKNYLHTIWQSHFKQLGSDLLNPISFSLITNDFFFRIQKYELNGQLYTKDRGYAFEHQLNKNTGFVLDKTLNDYKMLEKEAVVPLMIISPSIINDGKKLIISSTPMSFLMRREGENSPINENIDAQYLLKDHGIGNLKITSALRMSATFPYIMPVVSLPTTPRLDVMDAGLRDNYGLTVAADFIKNFKTWLKNNTAGVVIVQMRDLEKKATFNSTLNNTFSKRLLSPVETVYANIFNTHNYTQDQLYEYISETDLPVEMLIFQLKTEEKNKISLNWHLSNLEKETILNGVNLPVNQMPAKKITEILAYE